MSHNTPGMHITTSAIRAIITSAFNVIIERATEFAYNFTISMFRESLWIYNGSVLHYDLTQIVTMAESAQNFDYRISRASHSATSPRSQVIGHPTIKDRNPSRLTSPEFGQKTRQTSAESLLNHSSPVLAVVCAFSCPRFWSGCPFINLHDNLPNLYSQNVCQPVKETSSSCQAVLTFT
jgi:hypothetical protein